MSCHVMSGQVRSCHVCMYVCMYLYTVSKTKHKFMVYSLEHPFIVRLGGLLLYQHYLCGTTLQVPNLSWISPKEPRRLISYNSILATLTDFPNLTNKKCVFFLIVLNDVKWILVRMV